MQVRRGESQLKWPEEKNQRVAGKNEEKLLLHRD